MSWAAYEPMESYSMQQSSGGLAPQATTLQTPKISYLNMPQGQMSQGPMSQGQLGGQMPHQTESRPPVSQEKNVEVPKAKAQPKDLKWPDISEYQNNYDWIFIGVAVLIVEVIVICLVRFAPELFGKSLNVWYNRFKLSAVMADVLIIMIGFAISRYIYTEFVYPDFDWNPLYFTGLTVLVQIVHDILFYVGVIRPIPQGKNAMMDVFKEYAEAGGWKIVGFDSLMVIGSSVGAMLLKSAPLHITASIGLLTAYIVPYILETKNSFSNIS